MNDRNYILILLLILTSLNVVGQGEPLSDEQLRGLANSRGCGGYNQVDTNGTANFEKKKGHLTFPANHHSKVVVDLTSGDLLIGCSLPRTGMDVTCDGHAHALSVGDGIVVTVIQVQESRAVIVRHGKYFSVYANLEDEVVVKGDKVAEGQMIGSILTKDDITILHFELWMMDKQHETIKLDPKKWFEIK